MIIILYSIVFHSFMFCHLPVPDGTFGRAIFGFAIENCAKTGFLFLIPGVKTPGYLDSTLTGSYHHSYQEFNFHWLWFTTAK